MAGYQPTKADSYHEGLQMLQGIQSLLTSANDICALTSNELWVLLQATLERLEQGKPDNY